MWNRMPVSLSLKWKAWANLQGPLGGLRDDFLAASAATLSPAIAEEDREIAKLLPPWRKPSDYRPWVNLGDFGPVEYEIE